MKGKQKSLAISVMINLIIVFVIALLMKEIVVMLYPSGNGMTNIFNVAMVIIALGIVSCIFWFRWEKREEKLSKQRKEEVRQSEEYKLYLLIKRLLLNTEDEQPELVRKVGKEFSIIYKFTLPCGRSTGDFEKNMVAFEEYLGKKVNFSNEFDEQLNCSIINIEVLKNI